MKYDVERMRHCVKRIAHLILLIKEEFDDLCDAMGVTKDKEEVDDGRNS